MKKDSKIKTEKDKPVDSPVDKPIVIKSGATDLRRQERTLVLLAENNYPGGIKYDVLYAFSNKNRNTIKIVEVKEYSTIMVKIKRNTPFPWPDYIEKGKEGYTVELTGEKKRKFLKEIGCPENL